MQFISGAIGLFFSAAVLYLLRRDHIKISHALFWILFAGAGLLFGLFPHFSDDIAKNFGISYGPTLIIVIALLALVLRCVISDIQTTRIERDLRILTQQIGLHNEQRLCKDRVGPGEQ